MKSFEKRDNIGGEKAELCRGRNAFAEAFLFGSSEKAEGLARFYYTPLGMLIHVTVSGLDAECGVYSLEMHTKSGGCCVLPPLYCRCGRAWLSALTGKISACDILGGKVCVKRSNSNKPFDTVAEGNILSSALEQITLMAAE